MIEKNNKRKIGTGTTAVVVVLVLLLGALGILQYSIDRDGSSTSDWEETSPFDTARSFIDVLGGVRETLAAYFWTKTDDLHHKYFGGNISGEQALYPYYWMITRLDPHFTMAYYLASWMLCRFGLVDEGFNLALEGLRFNPDSSQLQANLGYLYFFFKNDPKKARYHMQRAVELTDDEDQKDIYRIFIGTIDRVLSGELEIREIEPIDVESDLLKEADREQHDHVHEDEHDH